MAGRARTNGHSHAEPFHSPGARAETTELDDLLADGAFLQRYCERILGDPHAAEDVVQETYLQAVQRFGRLERRDSLAPWLATVARRRSANEVRRRVRVELVDEMPERAAPDDTDPANAVTAADALSRALGALDGLSVRERSLLERQVAEGLSVAQLAEEDGSSSASVKSVLNRARSKLRTAVDGAWTRALAPVGAVVASARRHLSGVALRAQRVDPFVPGVERAGEAMAAVVATLTLGASLATPLADRPAEGAEGAGRHTIDAALVASRAVEADEPAPRPDPPLLSGEALARPGATTGSEPLDPAPEHEGEEPPGDEPGLPSPLPPLDDPAPLPEEPPEAPEVEPPVREDDDARRPEEASFMHLAAPTPRWSTSSSSSSSSTSSSTPGTGAERASRHLFALGQVTGFCKSGCTRLFVSDDGGATWELRSAEGLGDASRLLVAPGYPDDPRVYAMGPAGLVLSTDGGGTFEPVSEPHSGPVAMSPAFSDDDERILVGSAPSWVYDADLDVTRPIAAAPLAGIRNTFAFAPDHESSGLLFAGSVGPGSMGASTPHVHRCHDDICDEAVELPALGLPSIAVSGAFPDDQVVLAWSGTMLFRSDDGGATFEHVDLGVAGTVESVTDDGSGTFFLAWEDGSAEGSVGGVLRSVDGGATWEPVAGHETFQRGVGSVRALPDGRVLAAPTRVAGGGLLCSVDAGETWHRRCPS